MQDLNREALSFLYKWVSENKITHIRKGMVEDLESFVAQFLATEEIQKAAERMKARSEGLTDEEAN